MPKKLYDILTYVKIAIGILIPVIVGLNEVWDFSWGYQVIQTLSILEAAVIAALKIDSTEFFKKNEIVPKEE